MVTVRSLDARANADATSPRPTTALALFVSSNLTLPARGARVQSRALVGVTSPAATPNEKAGVAVVALPVSTRTAPIVQPKARNFTRATLTEEAPQDDRRGVRTLFLTVATLALLAMPAGAQPDAAWVRHQGDGFSVELPSSWADQSRDRTRLVREVRRLAGDDPDLAAMMDGLLQGAGSNVAVKMIAFDLAPTSLRTGFATNLNVVRERTTVPLAVWRDAALRQLNAMDFVVQPIWWRMVKLPAGKAVKLTYRARFNVRGKRLDTALTQYALMGSGAAIVVTYTTLPRLIARYRATFERSARSLRLR